MFHFTTLLYYIVDIAGKVLHSTIVLSNRLCYDSALLDKNTMSIQITEKTTEEILQLLEKTDATITKPTPTVLKAIYLRGAKVASEETQQHTLGMERVQEFLKFLTGKASKSEDLDLLPQSHPSKPNPENPSVLISFLEADANFNAPIGLYSEYQQSLNSLKSYNELQNFCCLRGLSLGILTPEDFQALQKTNYQLTSDQLNRVLGKFQQWNLDISIPRKLIHEQTKQSQQKQV